MDRTEAIELLKDINLFLRYSLRGDIRIVQALSMAIEALEGKDTNVSTSSAVGYIHSIHNVVHDNAYQKGYEQGKKDAAPTWDWLMQKADEWGMAYGKQFLILAQSEWKGE